jgi:hypothetical protein
MTLYLLLLKELDGVTKSIIDVAKKEGIVDVRPVLVSELVEASKTVR